MNRKQLITLIFTCCTALAGTSGLAAADETQSRETQSRQTQSDIDQHDLREEIASPLIGEFAPSGDAFRSGWQQDFGGMSGNANGMDGYPTASGEPSTYPAPGGF